MSSDSLPYLSIQELRLTFKHSKRLGIPNSLKLVAGSSKRTVDIRERKPDGLTYCWSLDPVMYIPSEEDLIVKLRYGKLRLPFLSVKELVVTGKELLDRRNNISTITKQKSGYKLEIVATVHEISDVKLDDISSLPDILLSLEDIQKYVKALESVFDKLDILDGVMAALDGLGNAHPIAQAAVTALSIPYKLLANEREFRKDLESFAEGMHTLVMCLTELQHVAKIPPVKENLKNILKAVLEGSNFIQIYLKKSRLQQIAHAQFRSHLDDMKSKFVELREGFKIAMASQGVVDVDALVNASLLKDALKPVPLAKLGECCMDGTRVDQLATIREWITDTQKGPNIYLIYGSPGAGKSTISSTLAHEISLKHRGTRFFFRPDKAKRRDPTLVWPTVAFELASGDRNMKMAIVDILRTKMCHPHDANVEEQFEALIREPLMDGERRPVEPFTLILDGLDECSQDEQWSKFLKTLRRWSELSSSFKLIVTSRDDLTIHKTFDGVSERMRLRSGDDVDMKTSEDIERFMVARFEEISYQFPSLSSSWPEPPKIQQLVGYAAGLFILAKTMLEWIGDGDAEDRLSQIGDNLGEAEANLDRLYHQILETAILRLRGTELNGFTTVLSAIVLAKDPLRRDDLKALFQLSDSFLDLIMVKLTVVVSTQSTHLRVRHKSFSDFLLDSQRSKSFAIHYETQSVAYANACLRHMNMELKFNKFNVGTSHRFNKDIPGYDEICRSIPTSLIHSSYHWAEYLEGLVAEASHPLSTELERFLHEHMLHWFEVLSLKKAIGLAPGLLVLASKYIRGYNRALSEFAMDGVRFVAMFEEAMSQSLPHIYISALPFAPTESLVAKEMRTAFADSLSVVKGRMRNWPAMLLRLKGHESSVLSIAFSADGTRIVSGSSDSTIRVWDADTGNSRMEPIRGHEDGVWSVAFSADGTRIVSGSFDKTIRVWDADTGNSQMEPLRGHEGGVWFVAFSADGTRIVSGSDDNTVRVWDADTGNSRMEPLRGHEGRILSVAFSADGTRIVSGSDNNTIRVWDADTGDSRMGPLRGHEGYVLSVAFSADGTRIVSGSFDNTIRVWDADTGDSRMEPLRGHESCVNSVAFSTDGTRIVSGSDDNTIRVWDADTGNSQMEPLRGHEGRVLSVAFSADGTRIVSGSDDNTVRVWDADAGNSRMEPIRGHEDRVWSVAFSTDGTRIVSGSFDKTLRVWDAETGDSRVEPIRGHEGRVLSVALSADGTRIVSGSDDNTVRVWDADTGNSRMEPLQGHKDWVRSVAFSADGTRIVSGSSDSTIQVWNAYTGNSQMEPIQGHEDGVWSVAFSTDGTRIVSGSFDKTIRVWDADTGNSRLEPIRGHEGYVWSVAFSTDGTRIVSGSSDSTIRVWDADTGNSRMEPLRGHEGSVWSVAFSADGTRIVSGSEDNTIRVWDADTGVSRMEPLRGHEGYVLSVAFSADGTHIVSGSFDNTIRVWDVDMGDGQMEPLRGHEGRVLSVAFSADGTRIVSNSDNKSISIDTVIDSHCFAFQDGRGLPVFFSHSKLEDGWLYDANGNILFWVPAMSRAGLYYPQTTLVIGAQATQIDLSRFMHGEHWTAIRSS